VKLAALDILKGLFDRQQTTFGQTTFGQTAFGPKTLIRFTTHQPRLSANCCSADGDNMIFFRSVQCVVVVVSTELNMCVPHTKIGSF
jgi:hypothetical protein